MVFFAEGVVCLLLCAGMVWYIVVANIEYRQFLRSLSPEELAEHKEELNAFMQQW